MATKGRTRVVIKTNEIVQEINGKISFNDNAYLRLPPGGDPSKDYQQYRLFFMEQQAITNSNSTAENTRRADSMVNFTREIGIEYHDGSQSDIFPIEDCIIQNSDSLGQEKTRSSSTDGSGYLSTYGGTVVTIGIPLYTYNKLHFCVKEEHKRVFGQGQGALNKKIPGYFDVVQTTPTVKDGYVWFSANVAKDPPGTVGMQRMNNSTGAPVTQRFVIVGSGPNGAPQEIKKTLIEGLNILRANAGNKGSNALGTLFATIKFSGKAPVSSNPSVMGLSFSVNKFQFKDFTSISQPALTTVVSDGIFSKNSFVTDSAILSMFASAPTTQEYGLNSGWGNSANTGVAAFTNTPTAFDNIAPSSVVGPPAPYGGEQFSTFAGQSNQAVNPAAMGNQQFGQYSGPPGTQQYQQNYQQFAAQQRQPSAQQPQFNAQGNPALSGFTPIGNASQQPQSFQQTQQQSFQQYAQQSNPANDESNVYSVDEQATRALQNMSIGQNPTQGAQQQFNNANQDNRSRDSRPPSSLSQQPTVNPKASDSSLRQTPVNE